MTGHWPRQVDEMIWTRNQRMHFPYDMRDALRQGKSLAYPWCRAFDSLLSPSYYGMLKPDI